jgi:DUF1365 family protein
VRGQRVPIPLRRRLPAREHRHFDGDGDAPLIATSISGTVRPLTRGRARALLARYPAFTLGVVARIHWQAAKLWAKRVPFFAKPEPPASLLSR